jgi:hypothetical protein
MIGVSIKTLRQNPMRGIKAVDPIWQIRKT